MKNILITGFAAACLLTTYSCKTDFETDVTEVQATAGSADFSKFVSVGNSLTSGYRDGALYIDGQNESFPSIIAQQMKFAGGGAFKQPLMADNLGGIPAVGFGNKRILVVDPLTGALAPVPAPGTGTTTLANIFAQGPYQNMGVPGAKSFHLLFSGYGNPANLSAGLANPYFVRFASTPSATIIADAVAQNPTFFSLWIGNNDVLGFATTGGDGTDVLTPTATFTGAYNGLIANLTANGAKGVVANIPNVTSIPFFTRVPFAPVAPASFNTAVAPAPSNQDQNIDALNQGLYSPLQQALTAFGAGNRIPQIISKTSANPVLIKDESLPNLSAQLTAALTPSLGAPTAAAFGAIYGQARQTTSKDLILLTTSSVIGTTVSGVPPSINKYGISYPLEDKHILRGAFGTDLGEIKQVLDATAAFNTVIKNAATSKGLAFVDANAKMIDLSKMSGIQYDGVRYTATFVTGGTFSLDGVHLTGRGYALIANEFLKQINTTYGSTLPMVNINKYSGVTFP